MDIASTSSARMGRVIEHLFLLFVCRDQSDTCSSRKGGLRGPLATLRERLHRFLACRLMAVRRAGLAGRVRIRNMPE
jgi:hypothetical protein